MDRLRRGAAVLALPALLLIQLLLVVDTPAAAQAATHAPLDATANVCVEEHIGSGRFTDTAGSLFAVAAECLGHYGVTQGSGSGYQPQGTVSRAQMATFLYRTAGVFGITEWHTDDPGFTDLDGLTSEQLAAVAGLRGAGIAQGTSATTFSPTAAVTRGQMAAFLDRLHTWVFVHPLRWRVPTGPTFFDDVPAAFSPSAEVLAYFGVAAGTAPRTFSPGAMVSRGQMAGFLTRLLELEVRLGEWPAPFRSASDEWGAEPPVSPVLRPSPSTVPCMVCDTPEDDVEVVFTGLEPGSDYQVAVRHAYHVLRRADGSNEHLGDVVLPPTYVWFPDGRTPVDGRLRVHVGPYGQARFHVVLFRDVDNDGLDGEDPSATSDVIVWNSPAPEPGGTYPAPTPEWQPQAEFVVVDRVRRLVEVEGRSVPVSVVHDRFEQDGTLVDVLTFLRALAGQTHRVVVQYGVTEDGGSVWRTTAKFGTFEPWPY